MSFHDARLSSLPAQGHFNLTLPIVALGRFTGEIINLGHNLMAPSNKGAFRATRLLSFKNRAYVRCWWVWQAHGRLIHPRL